MHFEALHPLTFDFLCTLHWCRHYTRLEVAQNFGKFPITALCRFAADGVVCGPVLVGALFAPTQGLHFEALHPLSFRFICTLHWCKHSTWVKVAPKFGKFQITALCRIAADGVVCGPDLVGAPFAPAHGLHFQALRPLNFHFLCTLHWCKHCIRLEVAPNLGKFQITALCRIAADGVVCGTVLVGLISFLGPLPT